MASGTPLNNVYIIAQGFALGFFYVDACQAPLTFLERYHAETEDLSFPAPSS